MICYKSTRGDKKLFTFSEAILKGIALDGGLFVPTEIPRLSADRLKSLVGRSYQELCIEVAKLFKTDFPQDLLRKVIAKAYTNNFDHPQITPLIKLKNNQYILELWHGPTSAFKDIALQLKPYFFVEAAKKENDRRKKEGKKPLKYLILVATSGDTGKAALEGYKNKEGISIIVFYPNGGISRLQELSMTTQEGNNVKVVGMEGDFDDTQRCVKEVFNDWEFNKLLIKKHQIVLSSANSINWGRLFPQIIYHVGSYIDLVDKKIISWGDKIDIAVPTGNFGNILAAFYAKKMGLPVRKLICASNANNVLTECLQSGVYDIRKRNLVKTPSPSMDILLASNFERLLYELTSDSDKVMNWMVQLKENGRFEVEKTTLNKFHDYFYADWVSNEESLDTIKRVYKESDYLIDPHTAVVQEVVERYQKRYKSNIPVIICSTAHWAKFPKDVYRAITGVISDEDEFALIQAIKKMDDKIHVPRNILDLKNKKIRHTGKCRVGKEEMGKIIYQFLTGRYSNKK